MGKSSSSSKKIKRSKEEDPSKLRSVRKKKKTKRSKSKKIRRIRDSSDESESDSSLYSSSSSEDDYRREKRRSKVSKKKKKRSKKRYSSSSDSDDDEDDDRLKRKKRSKRKDKHEVVTKKKKKNKRRRRDSSSSYTSSDDGSESDGKRMSREKGRAKDRSEEPDEGWQVEDDVMTENKNSKRLKSIVVVTYNYDDGGERKVDDESDENVMIVDDQRDGEATLSSPITGSHDNRRGYDDFEEDDSSEASHQDNSLKGDDLEAILKQRALENLKRFRGETQRNETVSKEVASVSEGETLQAESEKIEESLDRPLVEQELCVSEGDKDPETSQVDNVKESGTGLADLPSQQSGDTAKVEAGTGLRSCTTTKRKLIRPVLRQDSGNLATRKEAAGCPDAEAESISDKSCPESSLALATMNGGENMEPRNVTSTSSSLAETETLGDNKEESQSEQKTNDETKGESQYEQKTMTVMRGGELVQVSYKVYIPKKTSSLGRRQLRR